VTRVWGVESLDARCRRIGLVPVQDALRIIRQVATIIAAVHARGLVHGELTPESIALVPDDVFGERAELGVGSGLKAPTFMSPEQCRGARFDHRSDIYSLGCVLFAIITGRPPFVGHGVSDLVVLHLRERAPLASSEVRSLPPAVDALIARCLEWEPARRFASASDLANAATRAMFGGATTTSDRLLMALPGAR